MSDLFLQLSVPVATLVLFSTVAAAQYGFLPVNTRQIARGLEAINRQWKARSRNPHSSRHRRGVEATPLPASLQSLITVSVA